MEDKKKGYSIGERPVLWVSILGLIIGVLVIALVMALSTPKETKPSNATDNTINQPEELAVNQETPTEPEEEVTVIDHPIVGKWQFYKDVNDLLNSEWILVFNEDGTYYTDSSEVSKEDSEKGIIPNKDIYSYGTYSIKTGGAKEELIYFHEGHQKTLDIDFVIEEVDGVEQLTFYWGTTKISSTHDGEKIYETFIKVMEEN